MTACGGSLGQPGGAKDAGRRDAGDGSAYDGHPGAEAGRTRDSGPPTDGSDARRASDGGDAAATDAAVPYVDFVKPAGQIVYTNGVVPVSIATSAPPPTTVDVLVDGTAALHLTAPFTGSVPTAGLTEGQHALDCRATLAGVQAACATRQLVVDRTPPTVVETSPFEYAYASAGELVSATFSEPMAASSIASGTFAVQADGAALVTAPVLSADGRTLQSGVVTHPAQAAGTATVKGTITDLAGNALGTDVSWTWRWANAVSLGPSLPSQVGESGGYDAAIAVGADGLPVVVWTTLGSNTKATRLVVQRWDGSRWTELTSFPDTPSTLILQIDSNVTVDRGGRVLVAWTDQDMGAGTFATRVRVQDGGDWDAWDDLPVGYGPHLVVDDAGDVSLSMTVESPSPHPAVFRRGVSGWQPLGDLPTAQGEQLSQTGDLAGDAAGTLEIEWCDQVGSNQFVPTVLSWTGTTWQPQSLPTASGLGYLNLFVGMNRAGAAAFAWGEQTIPNPATAVVFVPGWTGSRTVDGFTGAGVLDIDVDPTGAPLVTFSLKTTLEVQRWSGSAWQAVLDQIHINPAPSSYPSGALALDDSGKPFLVLEEWFGGNPTLYVVTTP